MISNFEPFARPQQSLEPVPGHSPRGWVAGRKGLLAHLVDQHLHTHRDPVAADIPLFTTIAELSAAVASLDAVEGGFEVTSLQEYSARRAAEVVA